MIDADFAKFVDDYQAVFEGWLPQKVIEQRRFAAPEESGNDRHGEHRATVPLRASKRQRPPGFRRGDFALELHPYRRSFNALISARCVDGQDFATRKDQH